MNQLSILLIEDDPDDVELMQEALKGTDTQYTMHVIGEGDGVLPYLEVCKKFPNVIILDLNMPKKDGREALKEIKQHPVFKKIPVIIFTTTKNENEIRRCYELGANTYIVKPVSFDALLRVVEDIRSYWMNTASIP